MKILVTSGATREPIDAVRYLSNLSTGATGAALADALSLRGHAVTLLHGVGAVRPDRVSECEEFSSTADLRLRLGRRLARGRYDMVIMCAAVADYRPRRPRSGKLPSSAPTLRLDLVRNPKLLPELKSFSSHPLLVVGFKLTAGAGPVARSQAVKRLFAGGGVDAVVHNDVDDLGAGLDRAFQLHGGPRDQGVTVSGIAQLAVALGEVYPGLVKGVTRLRKK